MKKTSNIITEAVSDDDGNFMPMSADDIGIRRSLVLIRKIISIEIGGNFENGKILSEVGTQLYLTPKTEN